jgi:hypothetical protein
MIVEVVWGDVSCVDMTKWWIMIAEVVWGDVSCVDMTRWRIMIALTKFEEVV